MKVLFVYPRFQRHAESHPELLSFVPMKEYLGSPSLGIAALAAVTPPHWEVEFRDDRLAPADRPSDADLVALSFFTPAATRALELADYFRSGGHRVVAGGIFPSLMPEAVVPHVDSVVIGEGEGIWPALLDDALHGALLPSYVGADHPADLESLPLPRVSLYFETEQGPFRPDDYPVQISRGCGLSCQACALPRSMGPRGRELPLDHVIGQLAQLGRAGKRGCLTEDTSWFPGRANHRLRDLFRRMAAGESGATISYIGISAPMILHTPRAAFEEAKAAGVDMFYLVGGFDPITTRAFTGRDPKMLQRARDAIAKSFDVGIEPYMSFLIGLDDDDAGTPDRILEFAARAGIRKAEFAIFTPYPGTPAWYRLEAEGRLLHRDWARYNDANVVFRPAQMSPDELTNAYLKLWKEFYADKSYWASAATAERTIQF